MNANSMNPLTFDADSIHNIIITESETVQEQIQPISSTVDDRDIPVIDISNSDDDIPNNGTENDPVQSNVICSQTGNDLCQVIAVKDLNDLKQMHTQLMALGVLPKLPVAADDDANSKLPMNPSHDTINTIRNRFRAIAAKQNLSTEATIRNQSLKIVTKGNDISTLQMKENEMQVPEVVESCKGCASLLKRIKSLEEDIELMRYSVQHAQWKLANARAIARKKIKCLKSRLKHQENKLAKRDVNAKKKLQPIISINVKST